MRAPTTPLMPFVLAFATSMTLGCSDHGIKIHEEPPTASLLSPSDNTPFLEGQPVAFEVQLDDNDDGASALDVAWHSDVSGTLRGEATLSDDGIQTFVTTELHTGPHIVTVTATDPDGNRATDDVAIRLEPNTPPQVSLSITYATNPETGEAFSVYAAGDDVIIVANVGDAEQEPEELTLGWTLNGAPRLDGPEHTDATAETLWVLSGVESGVHTLTAKVSDPLGALGEPQSVTFRIVELDGDGDGQNTGELGGEDCDDTNPDIGPGAVEVCDGVDNDCDGLVDADDNDVVDAVAGHPDADGDGYGDDETTILTCDTTDLATTGGDCNDLDEAVNPGATEECGDGIDNDCDGTSGPCKWTDDNLINTANYATFGVAGSDRLASDLAGGDVNGDGYDDLIVGAAQWDGLAPEAGGVFFIPGPLDETVGAIDGHATALINGNQEGALAGSAVETSDVDGDGTTDLIIGAPHTQVDGLGSFVGRAYVFAHGTLADGTVDDADIVITGEAAGDRLGATLASGGDLDGDGLSDYVIASHEDSTFASDGGAVSVFLGGDIPWGSSISVTDRSSHIASDENDNLLGFAVSMVGDVNGDGRDDLLIGAPGAKARGTETGAAFLFHGHATNFSSGASRLQTVANATYTGVAARDLAGSAVTGLGDIDHDGYAEFAISAPKNSDHRSSSGAVYLMIEPDLTGIHDLNDHADVVLHGALSSNRAGESLVGQIDMDNDGVSDLVIGAPQTDLDGASSFGKAFLLYGPLTDLEDGLLGEEDGVEDGSFMGERVQDRAGEVTLGGFDWTGDGINDLAVTSPGTSSLSGVADSGGVFVFFGRGM